MNWSLSEFLNLVELRGQSWCHVALARGCGIGVAHGDALFFHAVIEGSVRLAHGDGPIVHLGAGDVAMVVTGDAHAIRSHQGETTTAIDLIDTGSQSDTPTTIRLGEGDIASRLVSGRMTMRWPGGAPPGRIPQLMIVRAGDVGVDFAKFVDIGAQPGASAVLTQLATLLFVNAFVRNPRCQALFRFNLGDPIARAHVLIQKHSRRPWTVETLAGKVGMGRSNFAARFAAEIGKTPIDALTDERMKHAEILMGRSDLKIAEVSEQVGYRSEAAFIRRFTRHFGMTPGKWRRQPAGK